MELEQRLARLESVVSNSYFEHLELKALRLFAFVLLVVAMSAATVWALFELTLFVIERLSVLKRALG